MEEEDQGQKQHCCKFCYRRFPCGRSLGGHMRFHASMNSSEMEEKSEIRKGCCSKGFKGYGLRENPKKTLRFSDSSNVSACKECGRGFQSWKALFGHMRYHSEKSTQGDSWSRETGNGSHRLLSDSQSNRGGAGPRRRSRRTRHGAPPLPIANGSYSSVSEIELEQEDVALSLMMLSRAVGSWVGTHSAGEGSDNDSAVFELRSSGNNESLTEKDGEFVDKSKWKFNMGGSELSLSDDIVLDGENHFDRTAIEYEVSAAKFGKNSSKICKSGCSDVKLEKGSCNKKTESSVKGSELEKISHKETRFDRVGSNKRVRCDSYKECYKNRFEDSDNNMVIDKLKKTGYNCNISNKSLHSYQVLGGHKASHKKVEGCNISKFGDPENRFQNEFSPNPVCDLKSSKSGNLMKVHEVGKIGKMQKKFKGHECPICLKVFSSGQALGGHKRSHVIGSFDSRAESTCQTIVIRQKMPEVSDAHLDLNLHASFEEDNNE